MSDFECGDLIFSDGEWALWSGPNGFWLQNASGEGMAVPLAMFSKWLHKLFNEEL